MLIKIYWLIWVLGMLAAGVLYLSGNLNPFFQILFGFLTFSTIFMGMISILPFWATHHSTTNR